MSKAGDGLKGLKETADSTLLADWHVTPELKAKLRRRIQQAEAHQKRRPVLQMGVRPVAVAAVSAAAVLLVGTTAVMLPDVQEQASTVAANQAVGPAVLPPPVGSGAQGQRGTADAVRLRVSPVQVVTLPTGAVADRYGNAIKVNAADTDATFTVTTASATTAKGAEGLAAAPGAEGLAAVPGAGLPAAEAVPGQKLVLNADFQLETADAATAMTELQKLAVTSSGYVVESTLVRGNDGSYVGRLVMRVPSAAYADAILGMDRFGKVAQQRQWSQDVTDRYQDLTVRIELLKEMEQKLQDLTLKAATFDDWLKLTQQLNENRAQLESLQGSLKLLANQVEYSTITVTLHQPAPEAVRPVSGSQPPGLGRAMTEAFTATLRKAASLGRRSLIGLAALVPVLAGAAVVGGVSLVLWRRRRVGAEPESGEE